MGINEQRSRRVQQAIDRLAEIFAPELERYGLTLARDGEALALYRRDTQVARYLSHPDNYAHTLRVFFDGARVAREVA